MLSCAAYSYAAINLLQIVPFQQIHSKKQFLKIFALSAIFCFSVVCGNTSLRYLPVSFNQAIGARREDPKVEEEIPKRSKQNQFR
jgi:hypothetical protein